VGVVFLFFLWALQIQISKYLSKDWFVGIRVGVARSVLANGKKLQEKNGRKLKQFFKV